MGQDYKIIYLDLDGIIFKKRYTTALWIYEILKEQNNLVIHPGLKFIGDIILKEVKIKKDALGIIHYLQRYVQKQKRHKKMVEIKFLTSAPKETSKILFYKKLWLEKHNLFYPLLFTSDPIDKKQWATPDALLIDDFKINIKNFQKAGGKGIHYTNFYSFIKEFEPILHQ